METIRNIARGSSALILASVGATGSASLVVLLTSLVVLLTSLLWFALPANATTQQRAERERGDYPSPRDCAGGHIQEVIPVKYKKRYQEWKREFLATATGRSQWERYAHHARFVLTITVSGDRHNGAITDKFNWDNSGNLTAATITLGPRIDEGYPSPACYPVVSSLAPFV